MRNKGRERERREKKGLKAAGHARDTHGTHRTRDTGHKTRDAGHGTQDKGAAPGPGP